MTCSGQWMIYGATGYTGGLVARQAVAAGERPVLGGRNGTALSQLADTLNLPYRVFGLDDPDIVAGQLRDIDVVMHCAGPFSATALQMAEACIGGGAHYLDITGEIAVFERLKRIGHRAAAAGVTLLPGVGFDVVPTDCMAAALADALPDATDLELAFCGGGGASPGTLKTMVEMMGDGGRVRRGGKIVRVPSGYRRKAITFSDGKPRWCMSIPWGDVSTAGFSTNIPNITVYTAVPRAVAALSRFSSPMMVVMKSRFLQRRLKNLIGRHVHGPDEKTRREGFMRVWGAVSNADGNLHQAWLDVPEGYQFTVLSCLHSVQRLLLGAVPHGYQTPSTAFGEDYVTGLPGCSFKWV